MNAWDLLAKGADIISITVGSISLVISIMTLANTKKIRSSMLAHVETSEYKLAIDDQVHTLESFKDLLVEGDALNTNFFLKLMIELRNISISYETILPPKLYKKISNLNDYIKKNLYEKVSPYNNRSVESCVSQLVYVITELKKEKKII